PMAATISLHVTSAPCSAAMLRKAASVTSTMGLSTSGSRRLRPPMRKDMAAPRRRGLWDLPWERTGRKRDLQERLVGRVAGHGRRPQPCHGVESVGPLAVRTLGEFGDRQLE